MKRSEIHVDDVLYYARPSDWDHGYTDRRGARVVVVSDRPWTRRGQWSYDLTEVAKGTGVLVDFVRDGAQDGPDFAASRSSRDVVQLAHLRGPYDAVAAEVEARKKAARDHADAARTQVKAVRAYVEGVVAKAKWVGVAVADATRFGERRVEHARVSMRADDLVALLSRLAAAEVRNRMLDLSGARLDEQKIFDHLTED